MAVYLNTNSPLEKFEFLLNSKYYVDKSNIIEKLNEIAIKNQSSLKNLRFCSELYDLTRI